MYNFIAYELHTLREDSGANSSAVSAINDFGCPSFTWVPKGAIAGGGHPEIIRHKEGSMACGGNGDAQRK